MEQLQSWLRVANLVFELDKKIRAKNDPSLTRISDKLKNTLAETGLQVHDPAGEPYDETRTDVEASIEGQAGKNLVITEVLKPIIYSEEEGKKYLIQKGVIIASGA
jgi:hypothetical protein